ncbi:MAG: response regulator, partial [Gammaproteobacteria bacterium]|nr:response regulator [Gammaproteobacteria bacterium]
ILDAGQVIERDFSGHPRRVAGVHIDISELRDAHAQVTRASRRLAEQRSELQAIIDAIPALVFYKDDANRILDLNRTAALAIGLPVEDIRGHRVEALFPPEDARKYLEDDRAVLRTGRPSFGILERYRGANGEYRSLRTDKIPLRGPDGHCDRLVSVAIDISEELAREQRLEQALAQARADSVAKSRFLESLGHEIRTALTAILGYADTLVEPTTESAGDDTHGETAAVLRRAGERLLATINDILDLSQLEAGTLALETLDMSLVDLLREIELSMRPRLSASGTQLELKLLAPIPERIVSDPVRLRQTLVKLVDHSLNRNPGGVISIEVSREIASDGSRLLIQIRDDSPSTDPAAVEDLLGPTPHANVSSAPRLDATQLGLMTARQLAGLLGGELCILAQSPGQWAGFRLELPLVTSDHTTLIAALPVVRESTYARTLSQRPLAGISVLVVEDGDDNRRLICHYLDSAGAQVTGVSDGAEALDYLSRQHQQGCLPALVVTDIDMPVMDGYQLAREASRMTLAPPMLALTAHALPEDRARCEAAGFDAYLVKPIDRLALLNTCRALIRGAGPVNVITDTNTDSGDHDTMLSEFADDPDMQPLLAEFVGELPERISHLNVLAAACEYSELGRLAHQLKGAGGGYGYPAITEAAALLERAARDTEVDAAAVGDALAGLAKVCSAAAVALDIPQAIQAGGVR